MRRKVGEIKKVISNALRFFFFSKKIGHVGDKDSEYKVDPFQDADFVGDFTASKSISLDPWSENGRITCVNVVGVL